MVSWKDAADKNDSVRSAAFVMPSSTGELSGLVSGATYTFDFQKGYASVVNDPLLTRHSGKLIREVFGEEAVFDIGLLMPGEDFSALQVCPAFFVELGAGSGDGCSCPHHNRHYLMDEDALAFGTEYIYRLVRDRLGEP